MLIMKAIKNERGWMGMAPFLRALLVPFLVLSLMTPVKSYAASCEAPGLAAAGEVLLAAAEKAMVKAMESALKSVFAAATAAATEELLAGLDVMDTALIAMLDWFWNNLYLALQDMTAQLHAGVIDQSLQFSSNYDASDISTIARLSQKVEADAKQLYQPTNQGCQFDTTARYLARGRGAGEAVATGYALDFNRIGNNNINSPAATGKAALQQARWQIYQEKFCDKNTNNGASGCDATAPKANMHVLPSRTIFAKETIDTTNADTQAAVSQLLFNITGYETPDPIMRGALSSAAGLEQRQENREYIAQMDAVGALAYAVIGDRASGQAAPEIRAMRQKAGVMDASETPSAREIRQAVVEQLSDPNYYKELYDSPATIPQKELYLKAYSLLMLYDIIARQEKISNVYAIEAANMLDKIDHSRHSASSSAPLR